MLQRRNTHDLAAEIDELLLARPARRPALPTPLLERAQAVIAARLPAAEDEINRRLIAADLVATEIDLARIERACRFGKTPVRFAVLRREGLTLAIDPARFGLASTVYALAVRSVVNFGFAMVGRIGFQAHSDDLDFVRLVVGAQKNFEWLDRRLGWFWFRSDRSRLLKTIEKVLSVAGQVTLRELQKVLFRRFAPDNAPSARALRSLCERIPSIEINGITLRLRPADEAGQVLSERERSVVELFRRWGPRIDGHRLPELCEAVGLGPVALGRHLRTSPLVMEPHPGVFRLIGS